MPNKLPDKSLDRTIDELRRSIDEIDSTIADLLRRRMVFAKEIGKIKGPSNIPIEDAKREKEVLNRYRSILREHVSDDVVVSLASAIIDAAKDVQRNS